MKKHSHSKVIVDTSVFISFFRGTTIKDFKELVFTNNILLSPYVRLELLQGIRKTELANLQEVLGGLELIPFRSETLTEAEVLLHKIRGRGFQLGLVDLFIAADARIYNIPVYSFDKAFKMLAEHKFIPSMETILH